VSLGHIKRGQTALVRHQVLHLPRAPHGIQPRLAVDAGAGAQAPQRIVQPVAVEDRRQRQRFVIGLRFVEVTQQLGPAVCAGSVCADFVEGSVGAHAFRSFSAASMARA
jgi:hypothetical protein